MGSSKISPDNVITEIKGFWAKKEESIENLFQGKAQSTPRFDRTPPSQPPTTRQGAEKQTRENLYLQTDRTERARQVHPEGDSKEVLGSSTSFQTSRIRKQGAALPSDKGSRVYETLAG